MGRMLSIALAIAATLMAQSTFEVASVKKSQPWKIPPGFQPPPAVLNRELQGRIGGTYSLDHLPLRVYVQIAYQLPAARVSAPAWMDDDRYDISVKMPPSATNDQVRRMLQALLIERFRMKIHVDQKETSVYALLLDKNGPKLTKTAGDSPAVSLMPVRMIARNKSMRDLAGILSLRADRPLVD